MKTFVLLVIGSAFIVLLAVGVYFLYYDIGRIFKNKPDEYFDRDVEY